MPKGMLQMGTLGWTPAAQLASENMQAASGSYAAMDKKREETQTTNWKQKAGGNSLFNDIMGVAGMALGATAVFGNPFKATPAAPAATTAATEAAGGAMDLSSSMNNMMANYSWF